MTRAPVDAFRHSVNGVKITTSWAIRQRQDEPIVKGGAGVLEPLLAAFEHNPGQRITQRIRLLDWE